MSTRSVAFVDQQAVNIDDMDDLLVQVGTALSQKRPFTIFTLNLDHLVKRRSDVGFREVYARATFVTADGWPIVRLARRQRAAIGRTAGSDLVNPLCALAASQGIPVAVFGSTEATLRLAADRLCRTYPALAIVSVTAPPFGFDPYGAEGLRAIDRLRDSGARLCFVALGAPKQEFFADRAMREGVEAGFACVGAALDFIAGAQVRAPAPVRSLRLEWAWRLVSHPRRLGPRYARCALLYLRLLAGVARQADPMAPGGAE